MDRFQTFARHRTANAIAAAALLAVFHGSVSAEEMPIAPTHEETPIGDSEASLPERATDLDGASVFLAPAIGEVSVARATDLVGGKVYAERSPIAGTAAIVSFSPNRPALRIGSTSAARVGAPLSRMILTSGFGALRSQGGGALRRHAGIDLAAPSGSPVTAAFDGRVSTANWAGAYGLLVVIDHSDGRQTRYAHLSRVAVTQGQQIRKGEIVGLVGSTGRSTGPHLHFELRQDGRPVDPLSGTH